MMGRVFGWTVMTLLALAVASYAVALLLVPELRHPGARIMFSERPLQPFPTSQGAHWRLLSARFNSIPDCGLASSGYIDGRAVFMFRG